MSESALSLLLLPEHSDSESQDEIIQNIARQLAHIGDRMDRSIPPRLVNHLAIQFMNGNLSEEVSDKPFGAFSGLIEKCESFLHCQFNQQGLPSVCYQTNQGSGR